MVRRRWGTTRHNLWVPVETRHNLLWYTISIYNTHPIHQTLLFSSPTLDLFYFHLDGKRTELRRRAPGVPPHTYGATSAEVEGVEVHVGRVGEEEEGELS